LSSFLRQDRSTLPDSPLQEWGPEGYPRLELLEPGIILKQDGIRFFGGKKIAAPEGPVGIPFHLLEGPDVIMPDQRFFRIPKECRLKRIDRPLEIPGCQELSGNPQAGLEGGLFPEGAGGEKPDCGQEEEIPGGLAK
jgi:hypothetical protein